MIIIFTSLFFFSGNKIDREDRDLPSHIGEEFARMNNMYFIETSAKECDNVEKLFHEIARELIQVRIHFLPVTILLTNHTT